MRAPSLLLTAWLSAAMALFGPAPAGSPERLLAQAQALVRDGKPAEALPLIERYLKQRPESPDGHAVLGFILFKQSKPAESLREYSQAAKRRNPTAFELKIVSLDYAMLEDYANADRGLTRVLELNPGNLQACNYLGEIKFLRELYEEAAGVFRQCLKLDPKNVFAGNGVGSACEQMHRLDEAAEAYRKAIAWQSGSTAQDPTPVLNLGRVLLKLNRSEEALAYLTRAVELGPEQAKTHEELGKAHSYAGELKSAQRELERAIRLNPQDAHLHYVLGLLYRDLGMSDKARNEFDRFRALKKRSDAAPNQP